MVSPIEVWVTDAHIRSQKNGFRSNECAIHDAIRDKMPDLSGPVHCMLDYIQLGDRKFDTSPELYGWQCGNAFSGTAKAIRLLFDMELMYVSVLE